MEKQNLGRVEGGTDASLRTVGGIFSDDASAELISSLSECYLLNTTYILGIDGEADLRARGPIGRGRGR